MDTPSWATDTGSDAHGRWADWTISGVCQRMRWVPPGTFWMGSPPRQVGHIASEPFHETTLSRGFWLGDTPVTQALWTAVMGDNPSAFEGGQRPVEQVSWHDVQDFLTRLVDDTGAHDVGPPPTASRPPPPEGGGHRCSHSVPEQVSIGPESGRSSLDGGL